jgi:large subunit ribosomal protein L5
MKKITINMGLGEAISNPKIMDSAVDELRAIAGQQPVVTKAKKSIATFKLREGQKIGAMVTLRRERMWEFFDRLVNLALPRVRDFKGVSPKSFDGRGNYTLGVREEIIFPEINYERIEKAKGMNITFSTTARTDEQGRALLRHLGMPFRT